MSHRLYVDPYTVVIRLDKDIYQVHSCHRVYLVILGLNEYHSLRIRSSWIEFLSPLKDRINYSEKYCLYRNFFDDIVAKSNITLRLFSSFFSSASHVAFKSDDDIIIVDGVQYEIYLFHNIRGHSIITPICIRDKVDGICNLPRRQIYDMNKKTTITGVLYPETKHIVYPSVKENLSRYDLIICSSSGSVKQKLKIN